MPTEKREPSSPPKYNTGAKSIPFAQPVEASDAPVKVADIVPPKPVAATTTKPAEQGNINKSVPVPIPGGGDSEKVDPITAAHKAQLAAKSSPNAITSAPVANEQTPTRDTNKLVNVSANVPGPSAGLDQQRETHASHTRDVPDDAALPAQDLAALQVMLDKFGMTVVPTKDAVVYAAEEKFELDVKGKTVTDAMDYLQRVEAHVKQFVGQRGCNPFMFTKERIAPLRLRFSEGEKGEDFLKECFLVPMDNKPSSSLPGGPQTIETIVTILPDGSKGVAHKVHKA